MTTLVESSLPDVPPEVRSEMSSLVDWLLAEGRDQPDICALLVELAARLQNKGLPVSKVFIGVQQLHPELFAETYVWDCLNGTSIIARPHGVQNKAQFKRGPIPLILAGTAMVRVNLRLEGSDLEYVRGASLRAEGATDAIFLALPFSGQRSQVLCYVTTEPTGFSDDQITKAVSILPSLACVVELMTAYRTASRLLDVYVGHDAGQRILQGEIRRGVGATVLGAIWFCDLAGFTAMGEALSRDELIGVLNEFFDAMAAPVERRGGTVLKFLGDGMLAFFPLPSKTSEQSEVCKIVTDAAREAAANIADLNRRRDKGGQDPLSFGIALHVGDMMYGNIGAAQRLDFTVIGPAVNYAARIEALSRNVEHAIIVSSAFARLLGTTLPTLGSYPLYGIKGEQEVFALPVSNP